MFFTLGACQRAPGDSDLLLEGKSPEQLALIKKGKAAYSSHCIACHNANPRYDGALAPNVAGSSLELLEARVIRAEFPAGYKPKGAPGGAQILMPAMPYLQADIPAIHAYLNALR